MIYNTTLTQKGQVTIPQELRVLLGLRPFEKVAFVKKQNKVFITSAKNFIALRGSIKSKRPFNNQKSDKGILSHIRKEYEKSEKNS